MAPVTMAAANDVPVTTSEPAPLGVTISTPGAEMKT